jgi:hypothetical protein
VRQYRIGNFRQDGTIHGNTSKAISSALRRVYTGAARLLPQRYVPSQRAIRVRFPSCVRRSLKQYGPGHELSPHVVGR